LLKFCIKHRHWSIFEVSNMVIEITTSRAITQQIIRHRSFSFQEFSQRYASVPGFEPIHPRRQDDKNRQNSFDDLPEATLKWFQDSYDLVTKQSLSLYELALSKGIAKESARFLLPFCTTSKLYMQGTIRSWLHYISLRSGVETQLEHRVIAEEIKQIFITQFPIISKAMDWIKDENDI